MTTSRHPTSTRDESPVTATRPAPQWLGVLFLAGLACKPAAPLTPPSTHDQPSARPPTPTHADLRGPVVSIDLTGTPRVGDARAALGTTVGVAYEPAKIAADVRALWRLRGIADVQVDARPEAGGVALRYRIRELPRIRKVEIENGPALYLTTWRIQAAEIQDAPQEPAKIRRLAEDLQADLVSHAFLDATVDWRIVDADDGRVDVKITVTEGPKVTVSALKFTGNRTLTSAELESIFHTRGLAVGQPFTPVARDVALFAVVDRYLDHGHIHAAFGANSEIRSPDGKTIAATYELREGDAYRVGKLTVRGTLVAPVREYEKLLGVRPGQPFNRSRLAQGIEKIRTLHSSRGAPANVNPLTTVDDKAKKVDLALEIGSQ